MSYKVTFRSKPESPEHISIEGVKKLAQAERDTGKLEYTYTDPNMPKEMLKK